jgi:hypothetical protein
MKDFYNDCVIPTSQWLNYCIERISEPKCILGTQEYTGINRKWRILFAIYVSTIGKKISKIWISIRSSKNTFKVLGALFRGIFEYTQLEEEIMPSLKKQTTHEFAIILSFKNHV